MPTSRVPYSLEIRRQMVDLAAIPANRQIRVERDIRSNVAAWFAGLDG